MLKIKGKFTWQLIFDLTLIMLLKISSD